MLNMSSTPHHHIYSTASGTPRPTSLILPPSTTSSFTSSVFTPGTLQTLVIPGTPNSSLTMTPNTIKSIEQSILQTLGEDGEESYYESQQYTGNFVPPLPSSTSTITLVNTWQGGQVSSEPDNLKEDVKEEVKMEVEKKKKSPPPKKPKTTKAPAPKKAPTQKEKLQKKTRSSGGPQPTEEEERRRVRRERNKQAAARCRKRRLDHTNKLVNETEGLEAKKRSLQTQITELQTQKEELEFILEAHNCVKKVKSDVQVLTDLQNLPRDTTTHKLKRPNTLNVTGPTPVTVSTPGIPINTPSNGIAGLGFEPLCGDWGVNTPTPVGETAAQQGGDEKHVPERDLSSKYKDLVTPVNPYKKLQDL